MSQWTHISGCIRFDGIIGNNIVAMRALLKNILGNTCNSDSSEEERKKCNVPRGSEGSIQYIIHEYDIGLPWAVVAIWGDLRDFGGDEDFEKIINWFENVCKAWPFVRQAILEVRTESGKIYVLQYVNKRLHIINCESK